MNPLCPMMREVSLETLPNINIRDLSHDQNIPIMRVAGSKNRNVFKLIKSYFCYCDAYSE